MDNDVPPRGTARGKRDRKVFQGSGRGLGDGSRHTAEQETVKSPPRTKRYTRLRLVERPKGLSPVHALREQSWLEPSERLRSQAPSAANFATQKFAPVPPFGRSSLQLRLNPIREENETAHADWRVLFR